MNEFKDNNTPDESENKWKIPIKEERRNNKKITKNIGFLVIFLVTGFIVFSSQILVSEQNSSSWIANLPIIKQIRHLAESADRNLKGEERDRINILLLGMGGKQHEGGYLTDTIMLASLEPSTKKASLISIPRDLAVPVENMGWRKINNINAFAEVENPNSGGLAVSQAISDILNIPVDYYVRIDFEGFVEIIDELGGIEVNVQNTLEDPMYPISGREDAEDYNSRFEHLCIEKGEQMMTGDLALKYARSRHAIGAEGSDFARARRQQIIIEAAKNKIFTLNNLFQPSKITELINNFNEHVSTNLKIWEIIKLWSEFKDIEKGNIVTKVIDNSPNGLLADSITEEGAYILSPRSGDFSEIQYFINTIFSDAPKEIKTKVSDEKATIEVRNGTWINGLASKTALDIEKYGFDVIRIGNSSRQNFQKSVIYDLTFGEKMKSLNILKEKTGADISFGLPQWLVDDISNEISAEIDPVQPDFILVIGQNADSTNSGEENLEETN